MNSDHLPEVVKHSDSTATNVVATIGFLLILIGLIIPFLAILGVLMILIAICLPSHDTYTCPECGNHLLKTSRLCPHCHSQLSPYRPRYRWGALVLMVLIVVAMIIWAKNVH